MEKAERQGFEADVDEVEGSKTESSLSALILSIVVKFNLGFLKNILTYLYPREFMAVPAIVDTG